MDKKVATYYVKGLAISADELGKDTVEPFPTTPETTKATETPKPTEILIPTDNSTQSTNTTVGNLLAQLWGFFN